MKIKFGAIIVAGSGKIGGHVASKNRGGAYLRTKVTPTNPNTPAQADARARLATLATGWSGLTESQRLGWNDAVKDFGTTDIFGDIKNPSGINLYVKLNANLLNSNQATISAAPAKVEIPFSVLTMGNPSLASFATAVVQFQDTLLDDEIIVISATPTVSQGTSFVKNLYRVINTGAVDSDEVTYGQSYIDKFGTPALGSKFFVKIQVVMANGQVSQEQTASVIVAA